MNTFRKFTAAALLASGLAVSVTGLASAETTPAQPPVSTGSATWLPLLLGQILSGSAGPAKPAPAANAVAGETVPGQPPVSTGSAPGLPLLLGQILSGSASTPKPTGAETVATESGSASGSSLGGGVSGTGNIAGAPSTGSAGTGSALPLCVVNPTTPGCPK
ncbi:hypothetical protein [Nocardia pseudobrasiliensis]|uniref:Uncharacterized protein n=1 Tax=Nocardia pseudobrasiliensis TaxID=45979 RepID=A0A370ICG5_9NOCA|nr:hypothetical protein [Nocardia pseudobrasiliensis]RDI68422.1 hypothetical protein DFR76_102823 [Nocardia pseudobrasiliensis]